MPPSIGSDEHPINVVNDRLDQVHAALDLLFTVGVDGDGFETLQQGTCCDVMGRHAPPRGRRGLPQTQVIQLLLPSGRLRWPMSNLNQLQGFARGLRICTEMLAKMEDVDQYTVEPEARVDHRTTR